MIYRNYLGLDLQPQAMRAVSLRRKGKSNTLLGGRMIGLDEGVLIPSFRNPNIGNIDRFIENMHEVLDPLADREDRISLALPEQVGIFLLADVESTLNSKAEGVDILKWQLREKLPADMNLQLDYQILSRDESGRQKVLVACMSMDVLSQYEEVIAQAGYGAEIVGFRSMGLFNYYRARLDTGDNFILLQIEDNSMSFQYYHEQTLVFHRARDIGHDLGNAYREISRSLAGEKERLSGLKRATVYLHTNWDEKIILQQTLSELFPTEPVLLDPLINQLTEVPLALSEKQSLSLVTAIGAAERLM